jgi:hypothetical protein
MDLNQALIFPESYVSYDFDLNMLTLSPPINQGYDNANLALIFTSGITGGTSTYCLYYEILNVTVYSVDNQTVPVGTSLPFTILTLDFEGTAVTLTQISVLPSFITLVEKTYTIAPPYSMLGETFWIEYTLSDEYNILLYGFNVIVTNQLPYFETALSD